MDVVNNSIVGILLQCIHILEHHVLQFEYFTVLIINYTSVKLKKIRVTIKLIKFSHDHVGAIYSFPLLKTSFNTPSQGCNS